MVETNEKPQDKVETPEGEDYLEGAIQLFDQQFGKVDKLANERIDEMAGFKEVVSKKALSFLQEIEEFKEIFRTFVKDQQPKLTKLPVFKKGMDFYQSQLNFNLFNIFAELERDIKRAKEYKTGI